jgi:predicted acylesterase/phospholipase RssA
MTITKLIIAGGGHTGIISLGIIQQLTSLKYLDLNNINGIYGTSSGAILGIILCLKYDFKTINNYIINRPWDKIMTINKNILVDVYFKKGVYDIKLINELLKPLLTGKDLDLTITLQELYNYSNIDLHMYTLELNSFQIEDMSYKTHPNLMLSTALYRSMSLPIIFKPECINDKCYVDGGILINYPLNNCLKTYPNKDEIFGIKNGYELDYNTTITDNSTLLDYSIIFLIKLIINTNSDNNQESITNEINFKDNTTSFYEYKKAIISLEYRQELLNRGIELANNYYNSLTEKKAL